MAAFWIIFIIFLKIDALVPYRLNPARKAQDFRQSQVESCGG
jgi:hypothetical protein